MPQPKDRAAQANADRAEDLRWMSEWYETPAGAARRLGLGAKSLERWCYRHAPETWARLQENEQRRKVAS